MNHVLRRPCNYILLVFCCALFPILLNADDQKAASSRAQVATADDLKIGIIIDRESFKTTKKPNCVGITAFVMNKSKLPVLIYFPGLTGPILSPKQGAVPLELRSTITKRDNILLEPGELAGRTFVVEQFSETALTVSAYYTFYSKGAEGMQDRIESILYSDGRIERVRQTK